MVLEYVSQRLTVCVCVNVYLYFRPGFLIGLVAAMGGTPRAITTPLNFGGVSKFLPDILRSAWQFFSALPEKGRLEDFYHYHHLIFQILYDEKVRSDDWKPLFTRSSTLCFFFSHTAKYPPSS